MRQRLVFCAILISLAGPATAGPVTYQVSVDTSSIAGVAGSLDFNFNPGPLATQAASLEILNFTSNGTLAGAPALTGDVSGGPLPADVTFNNGNGFNDYFEGFTFGKTLSFKLSLFGPALGAPDGTSTSGSTFAFSMFSDSAGTIPVLATDTTDGFAFTVSVNLDGTTTADNFSAQTSLAEESSAVPEPGGFLLAVLVLGVASGGFAVRAIRGLCCACVATRLMASKSP